MNTGIVKWFNDKKGYGFITGDDTGKEYFVHYTGIVSREKFKKLKENDHVMFELQPNERGEVAVNVCKMTETSKEV